MFSHNPLFLNTVLLGGTTEEKLFSASKAGFQQVELWRQDIDMMDGDIDLLNEDLQKLKLSLTDYQVLLDFDGAAEPFRQAKRNEALTMLDVAEKIGAKTLLVPANTNISCMKENIEQDLRWLVDQASKRNIRIAYEAMAWSIYVNKTTEAWKIVNKINAPNLGLVIDAFHIFSLKRTVQDLCDIPMEKIFLVQLSDAIDFPEKQNVIDVARHHRLLPGNGKFPIKTLIDYLAQNNYQGPIGLEVFNDDLKKQPSQLVAEQAMKSLQYILQH